MVAAKTNPILVILGTRPEAIKLAPVITALRRKAHIAAKVCVSGQHRELLTHGLSAFDIAVDHQLDVMSMAQDPAELLARIMTAIRPVLLRETPAWVVVQGDTTSALAGALAAFHGRIPIAHVEAGLRSGDANLPWPEEMNRRLISRMAALHFAPTEQARRNLLAEQTAPDTIIVTGNTVIDSLHLALERLKADPAAGADAEPIIAAANGRPLVLVTIHRRDNIEQALPQLAAALRRLGQSQDHLIVLPMHPNPRLQPLNRALRDHPGIVLTPPLGYLPFVRLLNRADLILTDSGGIQEEAAALGKPVLVLRTNTERPEVVAGGNGLVVGTDTETVVATASHLLRDAAARRAMARPHASFGDGRAAERIALALEERLEFARERQTLCAPL